MFDILARLFGRPSEPELDPSTLSRFKQLRERSAAEEPMDGKKRDLLLRMRGSELQTASIIRHQGAGAEETTDAGRSEATDRDLSGRKGF